MSFDPFPEQQPPRDPVPRPPLESAAPHPPATNARDRVLFPAVLLIVTGVIDLLMGGLSLLNSLAAPPPGQMVAEVRKDAAKDPKKQEQIDQLEKMGYSIEGVFVVLLKSMMVLGVSDLVVALLTLFAGVRMLQLRSYGLALLASFLAAIPFVSGSACCCVGEFAGLYAVIMLLQNDIRDAFR